MILKEGKYNDYFDTKIDRKMFENLSKTEKSSILLLMGRTHVRIKGENLNFYLETQSTTHNIYFKRLRILSRNLVHYTDVWMTLYTVV